MFHIQSDKINRGFIQIYATTYKIEVSTDTDTGTHRSYLRCVLKGQIFEMCIKKTASKEKRKRFLFCFGGCFGYLETKIFRLSRSVTVTTIHTTHYLYHKGIHFFSCCRLCSVAAVAAYQSTRDALLLLCCSCCSVSSNSRCTGAALLQLLQRINQLAMLCC